MESTGSEAPFGHSFGGAEPGFPTDSFADRVASPATAGGAVRPTLWFENLS
jgi:hypothetical protein